MTSTVALTAAGALILTGCGSSGGGSKKTGGLGGSSSSSTGGAATGKTYSIGFEGPLSLANAQLGINEKNGAQIAIDEANKNSSLGFKVALVASDDEGDPAKAPAAARTLTQNANVVAVVGPSFSGATLAVGKIYSAVGMPFVTPSASKSTLQEQKFSTFHRIIPNDNVEGSQGADWLARHGVKKLFVLQDLSPYGQGVGDTVTKEAKAKGIKVTEQGLDGTTTKNYGPIAQTIASSGSDAVFYAGYDAQAALLAKALKATGFKGLAVGGNGIKSTVFSTNSGAAGNGWYMTCGCADAGSLAAGKSFTSEYTAKFKTAPSTYSPEAYDATNLIIQAIKDAGASPTRASIEKAIEGITFKGITATIKFQADGDLDSTGQVVNLFQQKNGTIQILGNIADQK